MSLEKILKFTAGSESFPVLGYTLALTLEFHEQMFPTSSTCINRLYLPLLNLNAELWDAAFLKKLLRAGITKGWKTFRYISSNESITYWRWLISAVHFHTVCYSFSYGKLVPKYDGRYQRYIFIVSVIVFIVSVIVFCPPWGPGGLSRECAPPYPQRDRKRRLNGAVCRNHRIKRLVPCLC